jgi:hypothetical protein
MALAASWKASDPKIYSPIEGGSEIEALEQQYSVRLPEDFRSYLLHAAPKTTFMDHIGTQWWSLADINPSRTNALMGLPVRSMTKSNRRSKRISCRKWRFMGSRPMAPAAVR